MTINSINGLSHDDAIKTLNDLKKRHAFVCGTKGRKLSITTTVTAVDTNAEHKATALLDSGCEGSCIDTKYVERHSLNVHKLP